MRQDPTSLIHACLSGITRGNILTGRDAVSPEQAADASLAAGTWARPRPNAPDRSDHPEACHQCL